MAKIISTIKAILTRIIFSAHSLLAIWQVTTFKKDIIYWTLCGPLLLLLLEGIFTIMIKKTQEWRWFCPSVFLYLSSIVPAIWLLELDKIERRLQLMNASLVVVNQSISALNDTSSNSSSLSSSVSSSLASSNVANSATNSSAIPVADLLDDAGITLPVISPDTWTTLIEQFLMLILIVGRWLLPKGDLTRDQLSQLLLVYIGTAADIIEFFDSYKDDSIARIDFLVFLTLGIWSWSLMQFTIVLSATRGRRPRGSGSHHKEEHTDCCQNCCCGIDVWGIVLNVILQDAPFLTFRLLIIFQYKIINYMNVFFTCKCKNSLVIILQLYRLYVVNAEFWKNRRESRMEKARQYQSRRRVHDTDHNSIYMISNERGGDVKKKIKKAKDRDFVEPEASYSKKKKDKKEKKKRKRKDTGYSTASSQNLYSTKANGKDKKAKKSKRNCSSSPSDCDLANAKKQKRAKNADKAEKKKSRKIEAVIEETSSSSSSSSDSSNSTLPSYEVIDEKKSRRRKHGRSSDSSSSDSSSDSSSSSS
ncbi:hypothetical protein KR222_006113 [Zaprionus bogoriensis]|nr:hypothetical protein KR222_006113 [Zaprionus bogoriensis]